MELLQVWHSLRKCLGQVTCVVHTALFVCGPDLSPGTHLHRRPVVTSTITSYNVILRGDLSPTRKSVRSLTGKRMPTFPINFAI